jgi:hypothetical protein
MSQWLNGLSNEERRDIEEDNAIAYQTGVINLDEFVKCLVKLGYNATDIVDWEKRFRPEPQENDGD